MKTGRPATGRVPPKEQRRSEVNARARAGGWDLAVRLTPEAAAALLAAKKRDGHRSMNATINAALVWFSKCGRARPVDKSLSRNDNPATLTKP